MTETKACNTCHAMKPLNQFAMYPSLKRRARCRACAKGRDSGNAVLPCPEKGCGYTCATDGAVKNHLSKKHNIRGTTRGKHERVSAVEQTRLAHMRAQICRGGNMDTTGTIAIFGSLCFDSGI